MIVVTVPAHNEARFLEQAVKTLAQETQKVDEDFRIVIAEDGSTNGTDKIARNLAEKDHRIIHVHADNRLGRGLALRRAWNLIPGDFYVYIDCDLATDMKYYPFLINAVKAGYDLAIGSRYIEGARVRRPTLRKLVSIGYNFLLRVMFRDKIYDHQAGFKAFSKRLIDDLLNKCESVDWFWDTEIIVRAVRSGYKCIEFPIEWEEKRGARTPLKRLAIDICIHGIGLLKFRYKTLIRGFH